MVDSIATGSQAVGEFLIWTREGRLSFKLLSLNCSWRYHIDVHGESTQAAFWTLFLCYKSGKCFYYTVSQRLVQTFLSPLPVRNQGPLSHSFHFYDRCEGLWDGLHFYLRVCNEVKNSICFSFLASSSDVGRHLGVIVLLGFAFFSLSLSCCLTV